MADTSLIIGNGNWAVKETSLLGYNIIQSKYVPIEMTVVRATTATRVNSAGLIEVVPINLLTYSEQFDNAAWTKVGSTISANSTTAPNGTLTADKLIEGTLLGNHYINRNITNSNSLFSFSVFAKKSERNFLFLQAFATVPNNFTYVPSAYFDLDNGTVGTVSSATATIQNYGNGWYRCTLNCTSIFSQLSASVGMYIMTATANGVSTYLGDGTSGIFIWGAQAEAGTTAKEYFPTTDRFNIPRVDYSTGTASLLVEPQRTNLALYSEEFDNIYWTKVTTNITANTAIAPDGTMTADTFTPTSAVTTSAIQRTFTGITGSHTISVYARVDTGTKSFRFFRFNATDGNVSSPTFTATTTWQRFTWNTSPTITSSWFIANASTDLVPFFVWGAQLEAGSNATSYIPTVASSVTRNADVISKTGISSLIGQTEGTVFVELNLTNVGSRAIFTLDIGATTNYIASTTNSTNAVRLVVNSAGSATTLITTSTLAIGFYKIAFAYKSGDYAIYINGVSAGTSLSTTFPIGTLSQFVLSNASYGALNDSYNLATVFPTRLTNAQLATLTTI